MQNFQLKNTTAMPLCYGRAFINEAVGAVAIGSLTNTTVTVITAKVINRNRHHQDTHQCNHHNGHPPRQSSATVVIYRDAIATIIYPKGH